MMNRVLPVLLLLLASCNILSDSPGQLFAVLGLNTNKIPKSFSRLFKELRMQKANGSLQVVDADNKMRPGNCEEFVRYFYGQTFEWDIKKVESLKATDETRPIINAGLDLFKTADKVCKEDMMVVARMIDEGRPDAEIEEAAVKLDNTRGLELDEKQKILMELLLPYADKYGVKYQTIEH